MATHNISSLYELASIGTGSYAMTDTYNLTADIDAAITNPATKPDAWSSGNYTAGQWVTYTADATEETYYCHTNTVSNEAPSDTDYWTKMWVTANGMSVIGGIATAFTGVFDGQGHTISNLFIKVAATSYYAALFGAVGAGGIVRNLNLTSASIDGTACTADVKSYYAGAVVAELSQSAVVSNCNINAAVQSKVAVDRPLYVGTIVGACHGQVIDCVASGTVKGSNSGSATNNTNLGGVVGYVTGGKSGESTGYVLRCTSTTTVSNLDGDMTGPCYVGGIAGQCILSDAVVMNYIQDCTFIGTITHTTTVQNKIIGIGGIVGTYNSTTALSRCAAKCTITASSDTIYASSGRLYVGGVIGTIASGGTCEKCYSNSAISVTHNDAAHIGGFIGGGSSATYNDCYCMGTIYDATASSTTLTFKYFGGFAATGSSATFTNCWTAIGPWGGASSNREGFVGAATSPTLTGCYWDTTVAGHTTAGDGTGMTTTELKALRSAATGFNWDTVWRHDIRGRNGGYPFLQALVTPVRRGRFAI